METRIQIFKRLFPDAPSYRMDQIAQGQFRPEWKNWADVSMLSNDVRTIMESKIPWISYVRAQVLQSKDGESYKAALELSDGKKIETVLMKNSRGYWTICLSSQVGCPMGCLFCATGKMGLVRNLTSDEIIDQYRFWNSYTKENPGLDIPITNIVVMGMGEPMLNYENVRTALKAILKYTKIGITHITVSTVGVFPELDQLLRDDLWPKVLLALSLHSADPVIRKKIIPSSTDDFMVKIAAWAKNYIRKFGNRTHYLTFEYIMLRGVNDSILDAKKLAKLVTTTGNIKVNLIPYNSTGEGFQPSDEKTIKDFFDYLERHKVTVTIRKSMGQDILAACGQLATK